MVVRLSCELPYAVGIRKNTHNLLHAIRESKEKGGPHQAFCRASLNILYSPNSSYSSLPMFSPDRTRTRSYNSRLTAEYRPVVLDLLRLRSLNSRSNLSANHYLCLLITAELINHGEATLHAVLLSPGYPFLIPVDASH